LHIQQIITNISNGGKM